MKNSRDTFFRSSKLVKNSEFCHVCRVLICISLLPWRSILKIWIFMKNFAHRTALSKKLKSVFLITLTMFRFVLDGFDIFLSSSTPPLLNQRRQMMRVFFQRAKTERWWHKNFYFIRFAELQSLTSEFRYDSKRVRWTVEGMVIKSSQPGWSNIYASFMMESQSRPLDVSLADTNDSNFKWILITLWYDIFFRSSQIASFSLSSIWSCCVYSV